MLYDLANLGSELYVSINFGHEKLFENAATPADTCIYAVIMSRAWNY